MRALALNEIHSVSGGVIDGYMIKAFYDLVIMAVGTSLVSVSIYAGYRSYTSNRVDMSNNKQKTLNFTE